MVSLSKRGNTVQVSVSHVVQDDRASSCFDHVGGNTPSVAVVRGCRGIRSSTLKTEKLKNKKGGDFF